MIITILLATLVLCVLLWSVNNYVPMPQPIRTIVNVIIIVLYVLICLPILGVRIPQ